MKELLRRPKNWLLLFSLATLSVILFSCAHLSPFRTGGDIVFKSDYYQIPDVVALERDDLSRFDQRLLEARDGQLYQIGHYSNGVRDDREPKGELNCLTAEEIEAVDKRARQSKASVVAFQIGGKREPHPNTGRSCYIPAAKEGEKDVLLRRILPILRRYAARNTAAKTGH